MASARCSTEFADAKRLNFIEGDPMDPAAWIALVGAVVTAGINLGGYLIAWGVMKGTVSQLSSRVASLEGEMRALDELKLDVARLETRLDTLIEQVRDLNASIRWMREPGEGRPARGRKSVGAG